MKKFTGRVVSAKTQKTAKVLIERLWLHPIYKKRVKKSKKYLVHDEIGVKAGDKVVIQEVKPISKRKKYKIIKIL